MPLYEFKCHPCRIAVEEMMNYKKMKSGKAPACPKCGAIMIYTCSRASISGHNKGPGKRDWGGHFSLVDPLAETTKVAQQMENSGALRNNPEMTKKLKSTIDHYKSMPESDRQTDYDKEGHPLD